MPNVTFAEKHLRRLTNAVLVMSFSLSILSLLLIVAGQLALVFLLTVIFAPLVLIGSWTRNLLHRLVVRQKASRLADVMNEAASHLTGTRPDVPTFDTILSTEIDFVFDDYRDPFLCAAARLMYDAKTVFSETTLQGYPQWNLAPHTGATLPNYVRERVIQVGRAVKELDYVTTMEALGDIFILAITSNNSEVEKHIFSLDSFLSQCLFIADDLSSEKVLDAGDRGREILEEMVDSSIANYTDSKWFALMAYWINIRLRIIGDYPDQKKSQFSWLWASPSVVLSRQIRLACNSLKAHDFATFSEIVYGSFDRYNRSLWFFFN